MKVVNRLTDEELTELDNLRAATCGKALVGPESLAFSRRIHQEWGRLFEEISYHRKWEKVMRELAELEAQQRHT